jgi:KDO2-lipid IV(A) lauroyltransferase
MAPLFLSDLAMYLALRLGRVLVRAVPYPRLYSLAGLAGDLQFHLARGRRCIVVANLRQVLGPLTPQTRLDALARQVFRHAARNYLDVLTLGVQSPDVLDRRIEMQGLPLLDSALAAGRGAILVAPHMGNMDLLVQYLALRQVPITIPVERMRSARLFELLKNLRGAYGVRLVPLGPEVLQELLSCLRRGEIVGLVADRNIAGTGIEAPFFGRTAILPSGPGLLALRSGAPMLGVYAQRLPGGRVRGRILRSVHVRRQGRLQESLRAAVAEMAALLEEPIRLNPDQWTMFAPVWTVGRSVVGRSCASEDGSGTGSPLVGAAARAPEPAVPHDAPLIEGEPSAAPAETVASRALPFSALRVSVRP